MSKCRKDRITDLYPEVNEVETQLPRSWSSQDKCSLIGLSQNNLRAHYKGSGKIPKDAASVRTQYPIPSACGIYYFEVKVISKGREGYIGVGLCAQGVNMNKLPGWEKDSYGYHADDGHIFFNSGAGEVFGPTFTTGDVIGCGVNLINKSCFYTKNGIDLGEAFTGLIPKLYPTVGLQTPGEIVDVNFGQQPFLFAIDVKKQQLQSQLLHNIENFSTSSMDTNWQSVIQRVVSGYLVHYGYSSTAHCFAKSTDQSIGEELSSIRNRQRIQKLVLAGRISEAIETTQSLYPGLFDRNQKLFFQLKCRQFIEMINGCDGEIKPLAHSPTRSTRNSPSSSPARTSTSTSGSTCNSANGRNENTECNSINNKIINNDCSDITDTNGRCNVIEKNGRCDLMENNGRRSDDFSYTDMAVDGCGSNREYATELYNNSENVNKMENVEQPSSSFSTHSNNTPKAVTMGPSLRQLCGGNIFAIEKLINYGKAMRTTYKNLVKEIGECEENENLMKEAFSLLAYSNPHDSPVGYLLEASQRETLSASLNSAILEAHNLPGQPSLELTIAQSKACLKTMAKYDLAAGSLVKVENFFCEN